MLGSRRAVCNGILPLARERHLPPLFRVQRCRPFLQAAQSFVTGEQPSATAPMNLVLLSGFLGAGKTTVLEQLLRNHHGYKLGVIVNDMASVNVDANVLRDSIKESQSQSVSLENGCVCCTASDDLRVSVDQLLRERNSSDLDAIVVELSGVAEPSRVKQALELQELPGNSVRFNRPVSARTVTVVDTPAFATDFQAEQTNHAHHAHTAGGECDERFGTLLAEQLEVADLILLNKADVATEAELTQTTAMVKALNEIAEMKVTEHGNVDVQSFVAAPPKARDSAPMVEEEQKDQGSLPSCCSKKTCSSTNKESNQACSSSGEPKKTASRAESRFGITSFVYTTDRVMSRIKLVKELGKWQQARAALGNHLSLQGLEQHGPADDSSSVDSPFISIIRSKGMLLLDVNPDVAFYWSHAGKAVAFSAFGTWPEILAQAKGGSGAPRTELVFIGVGYQENAIRNLLDSCLLSDEEWAIQEKIRKL